MSRFYAYLVVMVRNVVAAEGIISGIGVLYITSIIAKLLGSILPVILILFRVWFSRIQLFDGELCADEIFLKLCW